MANANVFELTAFNQDVTLDEQALLETSPGAGDDFLNLNTAVFYVKTSDMRNTFKFQVDASDVRHLTHTADNDDINYFVDASRWSADGSGNEQDLIILNAANANMHSDYVERVHVGEAFNTNTDGVEYTQDRQLVKHDFMRRLSHALFNSHHFVDMFSNENTVLEDISMKLGESYNTNVYNKLVAVPHTNDAHQVLDSNGVATGTVVSENDNICKELFKQMLYADPNRFVVGTEGTVDGSDIPLLADTDAPQSLPIVDGDKLEFTIKITTANGQNTISGLSDAAENAQTEYNWKITVVCCPTDVNNYLQHPMNGNRVVNTIPTDSLNDTDPLIDSNYNESIPYGGSTINIKP